MSLNGSVERSYIFLSYNFKRYLKEDTHELSSGWHLEIVAGPIEINISDLGWHHWRKPAIVGGELYVFGYVAGIRRSYETFERAYHGDAEFLNYEQD